MLPENNEFDAVAVDESKLTAWPRVAAVAAMVAFSLPTFITGLEVSQGLTLANTIWALVWGSVIVFLVGAATGVIGAKSRMSSYLLVRVAFGNVGAGIVNIAFAISLLGWFGVNINVFTEAVARLGTDLWGIQFDPFVLAVIASLCMTTTTLVGFRAINIGATVLVPVLAIVTLMLAWSALSSSQLSQIWSVPKVESSTVGAGISAVVGAIIIGAIILPDITRFVRLYRVYWLHRDPVGGTYRCQFGRCRFGENRYSRRHAGCEFGVGRVHYRDCWELGAQFFKPLQRCTQH